MQKRVTVSLQMSREIEQACDMCKRVCFLFVSEIFDNLSRDTSPKYAKTSPVYIDDVIRK